VGSIRQLKSDMLKMTHVYVVYPRVLSKISEGSFYGHSGGRAGRNRAVVRQEQGERQAVVRQEPGRNQARVRLCAGRNQAVDG